MEPRFQRERAEGAILRSPPDEVTMRTSTIVAVAGIALALHARPAKSQDTAFAALQKRGQMAMGVDQYTSSHRFDALDDGGRIELQRDTDDSVGVAAIRAHIRAVATAFKSADFSTPEFVHMRMVPGASVMSAKRGVITYEPRDLPRGAELRIRTKDPQALTAIHEFMAFQRSDHHAGGKSPDASHDLLR